jgi:microcompartment protein CcmK/EutM
MKVAQVIGNVVATQKDPGIANRKLLLIQPVDLKFRASGDYLVAIDAVGAGVGEIILFASGSSARQTGSTKDTPCDCVIMAIIDLIERDGEIIFNKSTFVPTEK